MSGYHFFVEIGAGQWHRTETKGEPGGPPVKCACGISNQDPRVLKVRGHDDDSWTWAPPSSVAPCFPEAMRNPPDDRDPAAARLSGVCDCGFDKLIKERDNLQANYDSVVRNLVDVTAQKDAAYNERDRCVAALAWLAFRLGWTVGVGQHDPADTKWDADWRTIVYIEFPTGQASWHIHDSEVALVRGLPSYTKPWDGHTTPEKYSRLADLLDEPPSAVGPDVWAVAAFRAASDEADKLREHLRIARIVRDDARCYSNLYLEEKRAAIAQQNKLRADVVQLIGERDKLQEERDKMQVTATALLRQLGDIATTMHDLGLGVEADVGVKTTSQAACDLLRSLSKEIGANTTVTVGPRRR